MKKKVCLISFDNWDYDHHIVKALKKLGIEAYHINIGKFKHTSLISRFVNSLSKLFLNRNLKHKKRQEYIINELSKMGHFDSILAISPEMIDKEYHKKIRGFTSRYIAYLYDSIERYPVEDLLDDTFDEIYSFDREDVEKYGFKKINNYIYLEKDLFKTHHKYDVATIASFDNRFDIYNRFAYKFKEKGISFKFIIVGKNIFLKKIKYNILRFFSKNKCYKPCNAITFQNNRIMLDQLPDFYKQAFAVLDIVHDNQRGLSFRVYEALALNKKLITNNKEIINYAFYNPANIQIVDQENIEIEPTFFSTPYEDIPNDIYYKYTIDNWVRIIFDLQ